MMMAAVHIMTMSPISKRRKMQSADLRHVATARVCELCECDSNDKIRTCYYQQTSSVAFKFKTVNLVTILSCR